MKTRTFLMASVLTAALMGTGCASASKTLGLKKSGPNEFNILTNPPLIIPPEYNLRPPQPGEINVEEKYATAAARQALIGDIDDAEPSPGETILMMKAGAGKADPVVRAMIDGDNSIERKSQGFADRILFWSNGTAVGPDGQPLDPDQEARRLKAVQSATGGAPVEIKRRPAGAKLPGL